MQVKMSGWKSEVRPWEVFGRRNHFKGDSYGQGRESEQWD